MNRPYLIWNFSFKRMFPFSLIFSFLNTEMKNKSIFKFSLVFITSLIIFFCSCTGGNGSSKDSDHDGIMDNKDKCPETLIGEPVDSNGCSMLNAKLDNVKFYFDASLSNKGYYNANEFKKVIIDLTASTDDYSPELYNISDQAIDTIGRGKAGLRVFRETLGEGITRESSTINDFFETIVKDLDFSSIGILVSDCILSYPDKLLKKKTNKNLEAARDGSFQAEVKSAIKEEFGENSTRGYRPAFAVYAFVSPFVGTYYNCKNGKVKLGTSSKRPYYVWVLSKNKKVLHEFEEKVLKRASDFDHAIKEKIYFGLTSDNEQEYTYLPINKKGRVKPRKGGRIEGIEPTSRKPEVKFTVAVDIPGLENESLDKINKDLQTKSNSGVKYEAKFIPKSEIKPEEVSRIGARDKKLAYNKCSHLLEVKVTEFLVDEDTLHISMPYSYKSWYEEWSIDSDLTKKDLSGKTFAFDQIVEAFKETMKDDSKDIINIKIPIAN